MSKGDVEGLLWGAGKNTEHTQVLVLRYACGTWASRGVFGDCWQVGSLEKGKMILWRRRCISVGYARKRQIQPSL